MLPLLALIPLIVGGSIFIGGEIWDILTDDSKKTLRACKKIVILGDRGSGKTTLWNGLRGLRTSGGYTQTMGLENIESFDIKVNGRTVTIAKGADIGGSEELVGSYYKKLLTVEGDKLILVDKNSDELPFILDGNNCIVGKTVVFYLVSAADLIQRGRVCARENGARLKRCKALLGENGVIFLLLSQKNKFIKECGNSQMAELIKWSHCYFDEYGCEGHIPVELTNSDDIEAVKKLIIR